MSLDFSQYNYDKLVSQLREIVKGQEAWQDITVESGTGNFLVELFAYVAEMLMYTLERRAQETFIDSARLKSSIVRLVGLINYIPRRKVSSSGRLKFSLAGGAHGFDIYLSRGTVISTAVGLKFFVKAGAVLNAGDTSVEDVEAVQGEIKQEPITSTGIPSLEVTINNTSVENANLRVLVDDEEWTLVSSFVGSASDSKHCVQKTNLDDTMKIKFGDGKYGKIPPLNSTIIVEYVETSGLAGNIYSLGLINTIESTLYDSESTDVTSLVTVENTSLFLGGAVAQDKEEIRREAPLVFKTGDRAVTRSDFIALLEDMSGVETVYVWGERDETNPDATLFNKVRIVCLLDNWVEPDAAFKSEIEALLGSKEQLTVWLEFVDAEIVDTIADLSLKVETGYQTSVIVAAASAMLDTLFALGTVKLGTDVRYSDVVRQLDAITGVDYCHLSFRHRREIGEGDGTELEFGQTTAEITGDQNAFAGIAGDKIKVTIDSVVYDDIAINACASINDVRDAINAATGGAQASTSGAGFLVITSTTEGATSNCTIADGTNTVQTVVGDLFSVLGSRTETGLDFPLRLTPVKVSTVNIYEDDVLVASDDGLGTIAGVGITGSVDYASGVIEIDYAAPPALGVKIYAYYQQDESNDIVVDKEEIAKLIVKNISTL